MTNKYVKSFNFGGDTLYPLPIVTSENDGQVLKVVEGEWAAGEMISGPKLIEFYTHDNEVDETVTYQAEEGMTWYEWANSDYNPGDIACGSPSDAVVAFPHLNGYYIYTELEEDVYGTDVIVGNATYEIMGTAFIE